MDPSPSKLRTYSRTERGVCPRADFYGHGYRSDTWAYCTQKYMKDINNPIKLFFTEPFIRENFGLSFAKILVFDLRKFWSLIYENFGLSFTKILVRYLRKFWSEIYENFGL